MPYHPPEPPRVTVLWHPRDGHIPGIFVPAYGPSHAAYILTTSNWFKPVRKEPWQQ